MYHVEIGNLVLWYKPTEQELCYPDGHLFASQVTIRTMPDNKPELTPKEGLYFVSTRTHLETPKVYGPISCAFFLGSPETCYYCEP